MTTPTFEEIKRDYEKILQQLSNPELISDLEKFEELSRKKKELEKIVEKQKELETIQKTLEENKAILTANDDEELVALVQSDIVNLQEKQKNLEKEIKELLEKKDSPDSEYSSVIIEIRAGTGGKEAALFAGDLYKMYSKYASLQNWRQKILDSHPTEIGGFREIIFELTGPAVFSKIKYEAGVHRVQRIPTTEKSGRIHTSTATVAVLPKPKQKDIKIKPNELRIDYYRSSGAGGQNVQKRETAVRITHLPSYIIVTSQTERNQLQNKENAMSILMARLLEKKEMEEQSKMTGKRKTQIGWAKRAEKIRTYNFPQDRITDHRIKKSWHNLEEIMAGKLDSIIQTIQESISSQKTT